MKLIYGTYNPSKIESMEKMLDGLNINLIGLKNINMELVEAEESGIDPLSNACESCIL